MIGLSSLNGLVAANAVSLTGNVMGVGPSAQCGDGAREQSDSHRSGRRHGQHAERRQEGQIQRTGNHQPGDSGVEQRHARLTRDAEQSPLAGLSVAQAWATGGQPSTKSVESPAPSSTLTSARP